MSDKSNKVSDFFKSALNKAKNQAPPESKKIEKILDTKPQKSLSKQVQEGSQKQKKGG